MKFFFALLIGVIGGLLPPAFAQDSYSAAVKHFEYDAHAPLDIREVSVQGSGLAKKADFGVR